METIHLTNTAQAAIELTLLNAEQFDRGISSGAICPKMQRKDTRALRRDTLAAASRTQQIPSMKKMKQQLADLEEQLARADAGSLFDLKNDCANAIAATVIGNLSPSKTLAIADAIRNNVNSKTHLL